MGRIAVTGSVAFDLLGRFSGRFADSFLADHLDSINVSFLLEHLDRRHGGTAANIAYSLALLGERPLLCASVGRDFADYGRQLELAGVDLSAVQHHPQLLTALGFISTDSDQNQITSFYPGAMSEAAGIDLREFDDLDWVVVSPDAPQAMALHCAQAAELGARLVFAPAQQLPALSDEALGSGVDAAWLLVGNEYEIDLIESRLGMSDRQLAQGRLVVITRGARGSHILAGGDLVEVPAVEGISVADPTGAGDGYLAGLLAGLRSDRSLAEAGRMGSLAAAYVVEQHAPQDHRYTAEEFRVRYHHCFGEVLQPL